MANRKTTLLLKALSAPVTGAALGLVTGIYLPDVVAPPVLFTIFGAIVSSGVFFIWTNPHVATLAGLSGVASRFMLFRRRSISFLGAELLAEKYQERELQLWTLLSTGRLTGCNYRAQIELAEVFYGLHRNRFWATSLDRWSIFLKSNEPYIRQMLLKCRDCERPQEDLQEELSPIMPLHGRLFILPLKTFVEDVIDAPTEARLLVKHHLRAWRVPLRLRLCADSSTGDPVRESLKFATISSEDCIPDFMLVDDKFVYGRRSPESVDLNPLEAPQIELAYLDSSTSVQAYASVFESLWKDTLDLRSYCSSVVTEAAYPPNVAELAGKTRELLETYSPGERDRLVRILKFIEEDLDDFYNAQERQRRYPDLYALPTGEVAEAFAVKIEQASGAILAMDQADLKYGSENRFWIVWQEDPDYVTFEQATRASAAILKRRIFVLEDWDGLAQWEARVFIAEQLRGNVEIGLITKEKVDRLAAQATGEAGGASSAEVDSEFVIVNAGKSHGRWMIGEETLGFEVSYAVYEPERMEKETLLCADKMSRLVQWHLFVWDNCFQLQSAEQMSKLERHLVSKGFTAVIPGPSSGGALTAEF